MHPIYLSMVRAYARGLGLPRGTVWRYARRGWDANLTALDVGVHLNSITYADALKGAIEACEILRRAIHGEES